MMNDDVQNNKQKLFRKFLDGELQNDEEKKALHMIADDSEMREMLQFERTLYQIFSGEPDPDSFTVPTGFSDSVMDEIKGEKTTIAEDHQKVISLFKPKQFSVRPVYVLAAVVLMTLSFGFLVLDRSGSEDQSYVSNAEDSVQMISESESEIWIRFVYFDDAAEEVAVAGDFSNWNPIELTQEEIDGKRVWTGLIPVSRGEHQYMFVRDGEEWVTDPLADIKRDDGFGNKNAVLYL